jgi:hypothetical protein
MKILGGKHQPHFLEPSGDSLSRTIATSSSQGDLAPNMKTQKSASFIGYQHSINTQRELTSSAKRYLEVAKNIA